MVEAPTHTETRNDAVALSPAAGEQRIRVLHVINGEHYAGAERAQDLMALRLGEFGYDVKFVCLKHGRFAEMRRSTAPLTTVPMRGRFDLRPACRIARLVRDEGYALVHTHTPRSVMVGGLAAGWAGVPLVHHVQSPASRDSTSRSRNWINGKVEWFSALRAAAIVPVSESLAEDSRSCGLTGRHMKVVPNGVPARPTFLNRPKPRSEWTIGIVALFRPRKGLDVLLRAFADLRSQGLPIRLRAVGKFETPEYEAEIKQQVRELGVNDAIDWRGFQRNVHAELAEMDLFVLPSLFGEGLPFVILEAMSAGVPVISTCVEGIPEAVRDGQDGLIVRPGDPQDLARAIRRFVDHEVDWQAMGRSAHEQQSRRFTDRSMASGVAEVYGLVLAESSTGRKAVRGHVQL